MIIASGQHSGRHVQGTSAMGYEKYISKNGITHKPSVADTFALAAPDLD
jgi:hypothetical protein